MVKLGSGASVNAASQLASPDAAATSRDSSPEKSASGAATGDEPSVTVTAVKTNKTEQPLAGIFIGYDANPIIGDPANYPIDVADTMASGWGYPTGYIFEILRGRGLVYDANAQNIPGRSAALPGTFLVYAACDPQKVNEVIDVLLENIARLQGTARDMQPAWFGRSKQLITTSDAMENETPAAQAMTAALDELMGLGYNYHDQFPARINAVSLEDVRRIAAQRLRKCLITVSTPAPELIKVEPGTRTYKSFPPVDLTPRGVQHDVNGK
jgi:zinc protease